MNGGKMLEVVKVVRDLNHNFFLKKAFVNIDNVVSVEEETTLTELFKESPERFPEGLHKKQTFSSMSFSGGASTNYLTAVGSPETILSKV
tara:strand:- start:923 stop:1192 length:270 start_codon:yes stop_codon:yes gene_type:complete